MQNTTIAITGSDGFVGRHLCDFLLTRGRQIRRGSRKSTEFCYDNIEKFENWAPFLSGAGAVVHLAAKVHDMTGATTFDEFMKTNVSATVRLAEAAKKAGVKRFIFLSTIKVNGESTTGREPFRAEDLPNPTDAYSESKNEAETALLNLHEKDVFEVVIIRPPLVYGSGVKANFQNLVSGVKKRMPFPFGMVRNHRSLVYVKNLASLIEKCIDHPSASGEIFLVSDGIDLSLKELIQKIAVAAGVKSLLLPVPVSLMTLAAKLMGRPDLPVKLFADLEVDITKTREKLQWNPPFTPDEALKEMLA